MPYVPKDAVYPFLGMNTRDPSTLIDPRYSPKCENIDVRDMVIQRRRGYGDLCVDLPVDDWPIEDSEVLVGLIDFEMSTGVRKFVALTNRRRFLLDSATMTWGLMGGEISDCEDSADWAVEATGDVVLGTETSVKKQGVASLHANCADALGVEDAFSITLGTALNGVGLTTLSFWFYSTGDLDAGDWTIRFEDSTAADTETVDIPAITAATWTFVEITVDLTAFDSVVDGIKKVVFSQAVDKGAIQFYIDQVWLDCPWSGGVECWIDKAEGWDTTDGDKYLYVTNGNDLPLRWDGTDVAFRGLIGGELGPSGLSYVFSMEVFYGHLVLGGVNSEGKLVQWSDTTDFSDWTGGNSGSMTLSELDGDIMAMRTLANRLVVYSRQSIYALSYLGGDLIFGSEKLVGGIDLLSGQTVVSVGAYHMFLSKESAYIFDGTRVLREIGEFIRNDMRNDVDLSNNEEAFGFHDSYTNRVYWCVPLKDGNKRVYVLNYDLYDLSRMRWERHTYTDNPTCMGFYTQQAALTWDSPALSGVTWEEISLAWNDATGDPSYPVVVMGSSPKVLAFLSIFSGDDGQDFVASWETIDYVAPENYRGHRGEWLQIEFEAKGREVTVEYSIDGGRLWSAVSSATLTSKWARYCMYMHVVSERVRLRFYSGSKGDDFSIRWVRVFFQDGGET